MDEIAKQLDQLKTDIAKAMAQLRLDADRAEAARLEEDLQQADAWSDQQAATQKGQRLAALKKRLESWDSLALDVSETLELAKSGDETLQPELSQTLSKLQNEWRRKQFELKLSGPYDQSSAILEIHAGTGGTDAQDWAEMLMRMYLRYAESSGYQTNVLDLSKGEEAGIKRAIIEIQGPYAYGKLKSERGVHRLVRLSPFNANNLRQTSFALVEVMPELEGPGVVELDPKDLKIDVFRAGGHGGQSVNTTDSAVRVTHLPTGLVVAIQNERSQLQNKTKALAVLRGRLAALMLEQHKDKVSELRGELTKAEWGSQIRSYVLHPYTMVKDHRTGHETAAAHAVLDGELEPFIESYLASQIGSENSKTKS